MKQNEKLLTLLQQDTLFGVLSREHLSFLIEDQRCSIISYHGGESLCDNTTFRRALGLILCGAVDVYRPGSGSRVLLQQLQEGSLFGATTLFSEETSYVTSLVAKNEVAVFYLPLAVCEELIAKHADFALAYIHFLSDRIRFLNRRLAALAAPAVEQKLAAYLLREDREKVVNHVQLATALGIGRASLYRVLDDLETKGLIQKNGKSITVIDSERLRALL